MKKKPLLILSGIIILLVLILFLVNKTNEGKIIQTSNGTVLSNKKIGWGIRNDNHEQPDLGATNKKLIDENNDIAMGNNNEKYVYLTFDEGYEARIHTTNFRHFKIKQRKSSILHNRSLFKHSK